jgi:hypothetical protein
LCRAGRETPQNNRTQAGDSEKVLHRDSGGGGGVGGRHTQELGHYRGREQVSGAAGRVHMSSGLVGRVEGEARVEPDCGRV